MLRAKPPITYADDAQMTSCKFCYAEIHGYARVCPYCGSNQTLFGFAKGVVVTTVSIVTALASIGMAAFEKMEKFGLNTQLAGVMETLKLEEAKAEAATQAVEELASEVPDDVLQEKYANAFGEAPSAEKLDEIEAKLSEGQKSKTLSKEEAWNLQRQKLWLQRVHRFHSGHGHGPQRPVQQSGYFEHRRGEQTAERPGPFYDRGDVAEKPVDSAANAEPQPNPKADMTPPRTRPSRPQFSRRPPTAERPKSERQ